MKKHDIRKNERDAIALYLLLVTVNNIFKMATSDHISYNNF